ncbi:MAG: phage tail tape measure protein [Tissierellia bacterium]|nr:phage tail tape measure protein [Tissierellia bacterium]
MSNYDGAIKIKTKLDDKGLKEGLQKMKGGFGSIAKGIGAATLTASRLAIQGIAAMGTAAKAVGAVALKVGSDFEASMSQVAATMGITAEEITNGSERFELLKNAAKEAGESTQYSASEAAEALNYLALAGLDAEQAAQLLPKTLALASAGGLELGYATDLVTDSMSALGIAIDEADTFIDQMARTSQKSNTNVGQLGEAILAVGANAKGLANGTVELNTALGILANNGIKGAEGGTKLRNIIMAMTPTTKDAIIAFDALGISTYDAEGKMRPLNEIFSEMNEKMKDLSQEDRTRLMSKIFNKQDLAAAGALLASTARDLGGVEFALKQMGVEISKESLRTLADQLQAMDSTGAARETEFIALAMQQLGVTADEAKVLYQGLSATLEDSTAWENLEENIRNSEGAAKDMSEVLMDNLQGDIKEFKSKLEGLWITMAEGSTSTVRNMVQSAKDSVGQLTEAFKKGPEAFSETLGTILAQWTDKIISALPGIVETGSKVLSGFIDGILNNMDTIPETAGTVVTTLITAIGENAPKIADVALKLLTGFLKGLSAHPDKLIDGAIKLVTGVAKAIVENLPAIAVAGFELVLKLNGAILEALPDIWNAGIELFKGLWKGLKQGWADLKDAVKGWFKGIIGTFKKWLGINSPSKVMSEEIGGPMAEGMAEGIKSRESSVSESAKQVAEKAKEAIKIAWTNIKSLSTSAMEGLKNGVEAGKTNLTNAMERVASATTDTIKRAWSSARSIGESLAKGIADGISGAWNWVSSKVSSLASGVTKTFKKVTGIHSPSRVWRDEIGKMLVKGLAEGADEEYKAYVHTMEAKVRNSHMKLAQQAGLGGGSSTTNNNTKTVNIHVTTMDHGDGKGRQTGRDIGEEVHRELRRRGAI